MCSIDIQSRTISLKKFTRIVGNKLNDYPSFSLLLGAGCSVYSNIRPASELISEWKKQIYLDHISDEKEQDPTTHEIDNYISSLNNYDPNHEYSFLFEQLYDTPSQRRVFIEKEIDNRFPSIGYAYLVRLFEEGFFSTIFTTNFDDLANEAFYFYPQNHKRPIVCDEDSHISSITVTSNRPKIIKLHGDYLYDNIRATTVETKTLDNGIVNKFKEFAHETGLIVIGYSCGDDSVMDAIEDIIENDTTGFKNGIYWCFRKNEPIPQKLMKIISNEEIRNHKKNYIVYIDGFDETMCELATQLVPGFSIAGQINYPIKDSIIDDLCNNTRYKQSTSTTFKEEIEKLSIDAKKMQRFFNSGKYRNIQLLDDHEEEDLTSNRLMEYEIKEAQGKYDEVIKEIDTSVDCTIDNYKFFEIKMKAYYMLHLYDKAINIADKLLSFDCNEELYYINKAICYHDDKCKIDTLSKGLEVIPNSSLILVNLANLYSKKSQSAIYTENEYFEKANALYKKSMGGQVRPDDNTVCYLFDLYTSNGKKDEAEELIQNIMQINNNAINSIKLQVEFWLKYNPDMPTEDIINYIDKTHRCPKHLIHKLDFIKSKVYKEKNSISELKSFCLRKPRILYQKFMREIAEIIYTKFRNIELAIICLEKALSKEWNNNTAVQLFYYYCDNKQIDKAYKILVDKRIDNIPLENHFWSANQDWQKIINENKRKIENKEADLSCYINYSHALLQLKHYNEVKDLINPLMQNGKEINEFLIINYELAKYASNNNKKPKNERIQKLSYSDSNTIKIGAELLKGNKEGAKAIIIDEIERDYSKLKEYDSMYIFHSDLVDSNYLADIERKLKPLEDTFTKDELQIIQSF